MTSPDLESRILAAQREPRAWLHEADRLKRAADIVGSQFQTEAAVVLTLGKTNGSEFALGRPALMLIGYAIELLAKGLVVSADASAASTRRVLRHLDESLLHDAGVELHSQERLLVQKLYHHIRWLGKYPAPVPADGVKFEAAPAAFGIFGVGSLSPDDYRQACEFFDRLREMLVSACPSVPPGTPTS